MNLNHNCFTLLLAGSLLLSGCSSTQSATSKDKTNTSAQKSSKKTISHNDLLARAAVGDVIAQYYVGENYLTGVDGIPQNKAEAAAWMYLAYENSQREDILTLFNNHFAGESEEIVNQANIRLAELRKFYSKQIIENQFAPVSLSDDECAELKLHKPINRINPKYPLNLARTGQQGLIELTYTVSPQGHIRDIDPTLYTHESLVPESLKAMYQWQYSKAPLHQGYSVRFNYHMSHQVTYKNSIRGLKNNYTHTDTLTAKDQFDLSRKLHVLRELLDWQTQRDFARWANQKNIVQHSPFQYREINRWLLKAAQNGHAQAQYELGINLQNGQGCKADLNKSLAWLKASALQNFTPAKELIAQKKLRSNELVDHKIALDILRDSLIGESNIPKLELAWHLVASNFTELRNPKEALEILDDLPFELVDKVRFFETEAAAYAALGDFEEAIDSQEDALEQAQDLGWKEMPDIEVRLQQYKNNQATKGSYYL
ncbi:energy transducer TonB [Catenovulum sp. SX2]|uniref:energy transducer TonB n=1 Tax=Catenovulum sp. SX2 TaxID=3398614 RepID=UPI003F86CC9C